VHFGAIAPSITIAIYDVGVRTPASLVAIGKAVVIRVGEGRVGGVGLPGRLPAEDLFAIFEAIAVGIGEGGIGALGELIGVR
jgi:hypothetical protein